MEGKYIYTWHIVERELISPGIGEEDGEATGEYGVSVLAAGRIYWENKWKREAHFHREWVLGI